MLTISMIRVMTSPCPFHVLLIIYLKKKNGSDKFVGSPLETMKRVPSFRLLAYSNPFN